MDPTAPLQIAAWIVAGVLALLSGGCTPNDAANFSAAAAAFSAGAAGFNSTYVAPPRQHTVTCFNFGTIIQCN